MLDSLFRGRSRGAHETDLTGSDDVDLDAPIDSGAEDEVRSLLFETPVSVADRHDPEWLDITAPRIARLPPRVPKATALPWLWLAIPGALGVLGALGGAGVLAIVAARW